MTLMARRRLELLWLVLATAVVYVRWGAPSLGGYSRPGGGGGGGEEWGKDIRVRGGSVFMKHTPSYVDPSESHGRHASTSSGSASFNAAIL